MVGAEQRLRAWAGELLGGSCVSDQFVVILFCIRQPVAVACNLQVAGYTYASECDCSRCRAATPSTGGRATIGADV